MSAPLVIPHAQAAKLTELRKCALDDPTPPAHSAPMRGRDAGRATARCVAPAFCAESPLRRSREPREHRLAAAAVAAVQRGKRITNARASCESTRPLTPQVTKTVRPPRMTPRVRHELA